MRKTTSLATVDTLVTREIGSDKYLDIVEVAKYLDAIAAVRAKLAEIQVNSDNITSIGVVGNAITQLLSIEGALTQILAVYGGLANIDTTATNIADVNAVGGSILDVNAVAAMLTEISTVLQNMGVLQVISGDLADACIPAVMDAGFITDTNLDPNCTSTSILQTIFDNLASILAVAASQDNVNLVAANLGNISTVVDGLPTITTVATNISDVNTVATNMSDINDVVLQVIPNLAEILLADDNAATATQKALEASASANDALTSANDAAASASAASSLLDQFDDRYLGDKIADPLVDSDGNTLLIGALYFNTVTKQMRVWDGVVWSDSLTLTTSSISTLTNKTMDNISNYIGANHIHYACRNTSGATIPAGTVVVAQGTQSGTDYIEIVPVTDAQTQVALGITHSTLANNGTGLVINTGVSVDVVDTSGWAVGTILYPNNSGGLTSIKPTTGVYQACAVVLRSHATQGTLLVEFTEPSLTVHYIANNLGSVDFTLDLGGIV